MMTSLLPPWAPNLHPLVIHFPIALLIAGALLDFVDAFFARPARLTAAATSLQVLGVIGAVAAVVTGQQAAATVLTPGLAHPIVEQHRIWALATAGYFGALVSVRIAIELAGVALTRWYRVLLVVAALAGVAALQQTAERGARLVFEYGVGVIGSPPAR